MRKRLRIYLIVGVFVCVLIACYLALRPQGDAGPVGLEHPGETSQSKLIGARLIEMEANRRVWEGKADQIEVFALADRTRIKGMQEPVQLVLYREDHVLTCRADEAEIDNKSQEVSLRGNLSATSGDGTSISTEEIRWAPREKRLWTDKAVILRQEGFILKGLGMEADLALQEVRLLSNITSSFDPSQRTWEGATKEKFR